MIEPVDALVDAAVRAVRDAQVAESAARMGTVSAVQAGGTVTVSVADGTIPGVRLLGRLYAPTVGDVVEILRTQGGWVCLGALRTTAAPTIQSGVATTSAVTGWQQVQVTFPVPLASTPRVAVTPSYSGTTAGTTFVAAGFDYSPTGFTLKINRPNSNATVAHWIATTL